MKKLDDILGSGAAIIVRHDILAPAMPDGVVFPPTYAGEGYVITPTKDGNSYCRLDGEASMANRIEPLLDKLVPSVTVKHPDGAVRKLTELAHRCTDPWLRCTPLWTSKIQPALLALRKRDAEPLARLAPTSLVFGLMDIRQSQSKHGRIYEGRIMASGVTRLDNAGVANASFDFGDAPDEQEAEARASVGFTNRPLGKKDMRGGVVVSGDVTLSATISLNDIRALKAANDPMTLALRRYILGLCLVAITAAVPLNLRRGCLLVTKKNAIYYDGDDSKPLGISYDEAVKLAEQARDEWFGGKLPEEINVTVDMKEVRRAIDEVKPDGKVTSKKSKKGPRQQPGVEVALKNSEKEEANV